MSTIDKSYVEQQVEEWKQRIDSLYSFVQNSIASMNDVSFDKNRQTTMNEALMREHHVNPQTVPILDIYKSGQLVASFKPVGLWVIGANGRIDILTEKGAYILVDKAEENGSPNWEVFSPQERRAGAPFDSSIIDKLVNQA